MLDANMAIAAMNGVATVRDWLERLSAAEVGIPLVAIAELVYGAYRSRTALAGECPVRASDGTAVGSGHSLRERYT